VSCRRFRLQSGNSPIRINHADREMRRILHALSSPPAPRLRPHNLLRVPGSRPSPLLSHSVVVCLGLLRPRNSVVLVEEMEKEARRLHRIAEIRDQMPDVCLCHLNRPGAVFLEQLDSVACSFTPWRGG